MCAIQCFNSFQWKDPPMGGSDSPPWKRSRTAHQSDSETSRLGLNLSSLVTLPLAPISMLCVRYNIKLYVALHVTLRRHTSQRRQRPGMNAPWVGQGLEPARSRRGRRRWIVARDVLGESAADTRKKTLSWPSNHRHRTNQSMNTCFIVHDSAPVLVCPATAA